MLNEECSKYKRFLELLVGNNPVVISKKDRETFRKMIKFIKNKFGERNLFKLFELYILYGPDLEEKLENSNFNNNSEEFVINLFPKEILYYINKHTNILILSNQRFLGPYDRKIKEKLEEILTDLSLKSLEDVIRDTMDFVGEIKKKTTSNYVDTRNVIPYVILGTMLYEEIRRTGILNTINDLIKFLREKELNFSPYFEFKNYLEKIKEYFEKLELILEEEIIPIHSKFLALVKYYSEKKREIINKIRNLNEEYLEKILSLIEDDKEIPENVISEVLKRIDNQEKKRILSEILVDYQKLRMYNLSSDTKIKNLVEVLFHYLLDKFKSFPWRGFFENLRELSKIYLNRIKRPIKQLRDQGSSGILLKDAGEWIGYYESFLNFYMSLPRDLKEPLIFEGSNDGINYELIDLFELAKKFDPYNPEKAINSSLKEILDSTQFIYIRIRLEGSEDQENYKKLMEHLNEIIQNISEKMESLGMIFERMYRNEYTIPSSLLPFLYRDSKIYKDKSVIIMPMVLRIEDETLVRDFLISLNLTKLFGEVSI